MYNINMKIAVINASSQISKNHLLYKYTKIYSHGDVINFGCFENEKNKYSYLEISVLIGLLINSKTIDFVVTGCSSGQGMMLACNLLPDVICGYTPSAKDAYLFAQINNGNVVSLPLGEEYTYQGETNLIETIKALFSKPFGQGYPKSEAQRKINDSNLFKSIKHNNQCNFINYLDSLDKKLISNILKKEDVINYILENSNNIDINNWITKNKDIN